MPKTLSPTQREVHRSKAMDIAEKTGSRLVGTVSLPGGAELLTLLGPSNRVVLVRIDDDCCDHYVQGGPKWADLERDLSVAP